MGSDGRRAEVVLALDSRAFDSALTTQRRKVKTWGEGIKSELGKSLKGAFSGIASIAGFAGIGGIALAAKGVMSFEKNLMRLGLQARLTKSEIGVLRKEIFDVAGATGLDPDQLLGGMDKFVAMTGNIKEGRAAMKDLAIVAQASGADIVDISTAAAALSTNFNVAGKDMAKAFSVLLTQGKDGAVELKDFATLTAGLTPRFAQFGKTGVEGLAEMSAVLQIMKQGFGTAGEAATGFEGTMVALTNPRVLKRLQSIAHISATVVGKDGVRHLRDFKEIVFDVLKHTQSDKHHTQAEKLTKIFGREEATAGLIKLGQAGEEAFNQIYEKGLKSNEVMGDFKTYSESSAGAMDRASVSIKKTFNDALLDKLDPIATVFSKIADAIKFIAEHPLSSLGALAAFKGGNFLSAVAGGLGGAASLSSIGSAAAGGRGGGLSDMEILQQEANLARARRNAVPGNMLRGLGVGLAVASTLPKDLSGLTKGAVAAGGALIGLPGKLGAFGIALEAGVGIITAFFGWLDSTIDDRNHAILNANFGTGAASAAADFAGTTAPRTGEQAFNNPIAPVGGIAQPVTNRAPNLKKGAELLEDARKAGAYNPATGELDQAKLDAALGGEVTAGVQGKESADFIKKQVLEAVSMARNNPEFAAGLPKYLQQPSAVEVSVKVGLDADANLVVKSQNSRSHRRGSK